VKFKINKYFIKDLESSDHPSNFERAEDYSVLILRLPYIKNDEIDVFSYGFFIKDKVYIFDRKKKDLEILGDFNDLYKYLDIRVDKILEKISNLHLKIAKMEDDLYENNFDKNFLNNWLKFKKDLVLIERLMSHAIIAFERFFKYYKDKLDEFAFEDLNEHMKRAFEFSKNAVEKLDYLYEFYKTKQDEKMNHIMFILTIISAIFLPLTLVTGFFGMNTGGLPFVNDPQGTLKAVVLSLLLEVPFIFWIIKQIKS
jgi:magnesium transporter